MPSRLQKLVYICVPLLFLGCATQTLLSDKKDSSFYLPYHTAIALETNYLSHEIQALLIQKGFTIDTNSSLHVKIESSYDGTKCLLSSSTVQEYFARISIFEKEVEYYKIQLNQQKKITLDDFKMMIEKMSNEVIK